MERDLASSLKRLLNAQANRRLAQLGYSDGRIQDAKREAWWWLQARWRMAVSRRPLIAGSAVVWTGPGRAQLVGIEVPLAGPDEITIEVLSSVVSPGTERAQYLRLPNAAVDYPHLPGYSAAGIVLSTGARVCHLEPGDLVAARGVRHASVATVPAAVAQRVPAGVSARDAATLQLGVISAQGIRRAEIEPGEDVCVVGAGLIGLLAQRLAVAAAAGAVTVVAASRSKESSARRGGAARFLITESDDDEIRELAAPVVVEATGDPAGIATAIAAAGAGGRVVLLGSARGVTKDFPLAEVRAKGLRLIGAHVETLAAESRLAGIDLYEQESRRYLQAIAEARVVVDDLVDTSIDPREADAFYRDLARRRDVVGAQFDWSRLPKDERAQRARPWRLPSIAARGIDFDRKPIIVAVDEPAEPEQSRGWSGRREPILRIGLMGCGEIGVTNAAAIAAAPNAELRACFDPSKALAEELAAAHRATAHESERTLLESEDVDAVFIAAPHHLHTPLAIRAAEAGKHVIVEKPPANNLDAALEAVAAAKRAGVVFSVCFPQRYQPHVTRARQLVASGALGDVTGMFLNALSRKPESYWYGGYSGRVTSDWRASKEKAGGGFLIMNMCHYIDLIRYVISVDAQTVAAAVEQPAGGREVEDAISLTVRLENGAIGSFFGSSALPGFETGRTDIHVWGSEGHLSLEPRPSIYTLSARPGLRTGRWHAYNGLQPPLGEVEIRTMFVSRLATAIERGEQPDVTASDGLAIQAFIEAAYRSSELVEPVRPADLLEVAATGVAA